MIVLHSKVSFSDSPFVSCRLWCRELTFLLLPILLCRTWSTSLSFQLGLKNVARSLGSFTRYAVETDLRTHTRNSQKFRSCRSLAGNHGVYSENRARAECKTT